METKKVVPVEPLTAAIARGWCHPMNSHKEMDTNLVFAIADEVTKWLVAALRAEVERMTMQAAACMTAAFQNTRDSAKERIGRDNPYWTQAYQDVCDAVDREIEWRERAQSSEHNFGIEHDRAESAERRLAVAVGALRLLRNHSSVNAHQIEIIDAALQEVK